MPDDENKVYTTTFGDFVEDPTRPGVYLAEEIDPTELTVPASVSRTGQGMPLVVNPSTVFITSENGEKAAPYETTLTIERIQGIPEGSGNFNGLNRVAYFNNLSLVASLANSSGFTYQIQKASEISTHSPQPQIDTLLPVRIALANSDLDQGPFALVTNNHGGGIVNLEDGDTEVTVSKLAGVPRIQNLNLTQDEINAFGSFIIGHEVKHLNSDREPGRVYKDWETYIAEVKGDHDTLNIYFNEDFSQLAMDMRALGSLNRIVETDDHATHIWSEEFRSGVMPTEEQANKIMAAPDLIGTVLTNSLDDDEDIITSINANPAERYIYLATLRAQEKFNEAESKNEYVTEYLDKYIDAVERRYPSTDIEAASQRVIMRQASELAYIAEPDADLSEGDVADKLRNDPVYYYANMKVMRENGVFDSIPRANDIIDRRLADIERENPDLFRGIDMDSYRERYEEEPSAPQENIPIAKPLPLTPPANPAMSNM